MQRPLSLLLVGLTFIASQAQAQTKPVVQAHVIPPLTGPATVQAGYYFTFGAQATIAADAPGDATATVDPLGVGRSTFVLRLTKTTGINGKPCPAGQQCFYGGFTLDVRLTTGDHQVPVTVTDSKGRQGTGMLTLTTTPPFDFDHNGLPDAWESEFRISDGPDGDPDGDGISNLEEFRAGTNPIEKYTRLFAEGSSGDAQPLRNCVTWVSTALPQYEPFTPVRVVYVGDNGRVAIAPSYATNYPTGACPLSDAVADRVVEIRVESLVPLAVERGTTSGLSPADSNLGQVVNSSLGVQEPSRTWTFADGHTADGIDMFLLLYNPSSDPVTAQLTYVRAPSTVVARTTRELAPGVRTTIWVNRDQQEAVGGDVSVLINASAGILAERAFRYHAPGRTVPQDSVTRGGWITSTHWFFPDVDSRGPYTSSLVVMNPSATPARVTVTTLSPTGGSPVRADIALTAGERRELTMRDLPAPANSTFGVLLDSASGVGIVAERVTSGATDSGAWRRAALGATQPGTKWVFPTVEYLSVSDTDLVVMNVSDTPARVNISMRSRGFECCDNSQGTVEIPARSSTHVALGLNDPARTINVLLSGMLTVESVANGSGNVAQIVVERVTHWDQDGVHHGRAMSVIGNQVQ